MGLVDKKGVVGMKAKIQWLQVIEKNTHKTKKYMSQLHEKNTVGIDFT